MVEKRPYPGGNGVQQDTKRPRPSDTPSAAPAKKPNIADAIARARAAAQAIAHKGGNASGDARSAAPPPPPPSASTNLASIRARIDALKNQQQPPTRPPPPPAPSAPSSLDDIKARIAALKTREADRSLTPRNGAHFTPPPPPPEPEVEAPRVRGGLAIGLHPALLGDSAQAPPKFASTTKGNRRWEAGTPEPAQKKQLDLAGPSVEEMRQNPYFDPRLSTSAGRERISRSLVFNPKGKYVEQANKFRAQARLEELKLQVAAAARRAGVDENSERGFIVNEPPDVEWWDEGILEDKTYDCIDNPAMVKIASDDSIITSYVQHPVLLKPPQEQRLIQIKPMYLTQKEQAKLRRMRRAAELKETQAKIRLGLEPPPPPKVKRGNMMRVMGEQAIADPTAVELLVEKQIADRNEAHEKANEDRKLTKEQRHEKLAQQQQTDAQKGLHMCVFKIDSLAYGKSRYKIDVNAKEHVLTGVLILNPDLNMVVVEGGAHSIEKYKKLMLQRINWAENALPNDGGKQVEQKWLQPVDENGQLKDLADNKCTLIFEGEVKDRAFRRWNTKVCETDGDAREYLARAKLDSLWALAKSTE